ncbi:DUF4030 domain-containing protein [Ureibacillus aquaedulcis]|uniref:DUF4030 domain-containing protein n=1 Tax=Ureibacillus aquaedulcis TaxID=3058421 RepID=A0ABT8GTC9_9BACL|nr:DUF4030 domain-containing protein [Ureibacillus sp. BA0131]MDN4494672.1 DUF4030 domain-containing protein [Ureibacillus sp. BA0131]
MEKELKKLNEYYRENNFNDEIADQIKNKVHQNLDKVDILLLPEKKRSYSIVKRIVQIAAACLVLFGLILGTAFISPAMAEVASKIPFLNMIFTQKPISHLIMEELEEQNYEIAGSGYSVQDKTFDVTVRGSEEYFNQVKGEIEKVTKELISSRGYDDFKVEVERERIIEHNADYDNDRRVRDADLVMEVLGEIVPKLQQQGYKIPTAYGVGYASPDSQEITVTLDIEDKETRTDEIEDAILEEVKKQGIQEEIKVEFHSFNVEAREIEMQWSSEVLPVIFEGMLNKKEYKTKGVGYSYKKGTMNIFITTKVDKTDKEAPELANKIENAIEEFLQSDDLKDIVGDKPYKVVVRDKHSEDIN